MDGNTLSLEASVVSGIVMSPDKCLTEAISLGLDEETFESPELKKIFSKAVGIYNKTNSPPDEIMIMDELMSNGWDDSLKHAWMLVTSDDSQTLRFTEKATLLVNKGYRRHVRAAYAPLKLIDDSISDEEMDDLKEKHAKLLSEAERYNTNDAIEIDEAIAELIQEADKSIIQEECDPGCLMSHIDGFDEVMTPVERGEFWVIGARPSVGKSSFATMTCIENIKEDKKVVYFPIESNAKEVMRQMSAQAAKVNFRKLHEYPEKRQTLYKKYLKRFKEINKEKLFIKRESKLVKMDNYLRSVVSKSGGVDIIIVDYIQLIRAGTNKDNRSTQIGFATRMLKEWAGRYNCVVIGLAQLSRSHTIQREEQMPTLSDLRESGDIEADANRVTFLHRYKDQKDGHVKKIKIIQAKQRFGPLANMEVRFNSELTRFYVPESEKGKDW